LREGGRKRGRVGKEIHFIQAHTFKRIAYSIVIYVIDHTLN